MGWGNEHMKKCKMGWGNEHIKGKRKSLNKEIKVG